MISEITRRECFDSALASYAVAAASGVVEHRVVIAGEPVSFRYADRTLERELGAAFAHHPMTTAEPGLVIDVWESESSGAPPPRITIDAFDGGVSADTRIGGAQTIECRYDGDRRILSVFDRDTATGAFCVADPADLPHWERGSPFRQILAWWFRDHGKHLLHGAAVGNAESGLLLVGRGGSGKSSSALACLEAPIPQLGVAGDDYCVVDVGADAAAWSLYRSAKVGWQERRWFPGLAGGVVNTDDGEAEKALLMLGPPNSPPLVDRVAVRAVVVPTVDPDGVTAVEPVSKAAALQALAPSSIFQLAGPNATDFRELAAFVAARPAFRLRLGGDPLAVPPLLAQLVERVAP